MKNDILVRYQKSVFVLAIVLIILFFSSCNYKITTSDGGIGDVSSIAKTDIYGPYEVVRVVDGDTIIVDLDSNETRIRMIGIDTPESVHPDSDKNTNEGKMVSDFTKKQLNGKTVYLEYDEDREDDYGRTLAYVYLDADGTDMYQELLLKKGYASVMIISPNTKYAEHFRALAEKAKNDDVGLWKNYFAKS